MSIERLMRIAADLEPAELAEVIDLADHLRARHEGAEEGQALLEKFSANPSAIERLQALVQVGRDAVARGEVSDGPTAVAALRAKYNMNEPRE